MLGEKVGHIDGSDCEFKPWAKAGKLDNSDLRAIEEPGE